MARVTAVADEREEPAVRGFLHEPDGTASHGLVLAHGAGSNCRAPVLVRMAEALVQAGVAVLRIDLPFRQERPHGPPFPAMAPRDQQGLRRAATVLREQVRGQVFLGGHSYGGRQATLLAAGDPAVAEGLLLLAYPLHPPRTPGQLRTAHFPNLRLPALFVHGTRDPFGSEEEMRQALALIPAPVRLVTIAGAGHDLRASGAVEQAAAAFREFAGL